MYESVTIDTEPRERRVTPWLGSSTAFSPITKMLSMLSSARRESTGSEAETNFTSEGSHDAGVVDYLDGGLVGGTEDEYQSGECHHGQEEDGHEYGGDDETFAFHPFEIFTLYDET